MKKSLLYALIALALAIGAVLVACGGGSDNSNKDKAQPTAVEQQDNQDNGDQQAEPTAKATAKASSGGGSGDAIGDVPVYPGAKKMSGGEWSGSEAAIPALGSDVNAGDYSKVQYAMYETSDSAQDVLDWYKDKMSDWKNEGSFSGGDEGQVGGFASWTKDDGSVAAWISVGEDSGTTTLGLFVGSQ